MTLPIFGVSYFTAIALVCVATGVIGMCYAVFGGLKAVAYSDTINGVGLIIGGFAVPILGIIALGQLDNGGFFAGIEHFITATPEKMNAWSAPSALPPEVPWPLLFTGMFVNNLFYWATNQSIIQRALGGKNLAEGQKGAIWAGFFKCLDVFVIVIPGIIAYQLLAANGQMDTSVGMAADQAYPLLVMEVIPKPLLGFLAAVMFGAILSSFNSVLNSASTMFTLDLYRSVFKPSASDVECVKVGKIYGTIAGIVSICVAPFVSFTGNGITTLLNSLANFVSMPIAWTILAAIVFKNIPKWAPKLITVVDVVFYGAFLLLKPVYPTNPTEEIHYLYAIAALFFIDWIILWACNKFAPRAETLVLKDVGAVDLTPWKYGKIVAIVGVILAIAIYILFSPLGIASAAEPVSWLDVWNVAV